MPKTAMRISHSEARQGAYTASEERILISGEKSVDE